MPRVFELLVLLSYWRPGVWRDLVELLVLLSYTIHTYIYMYLYMYIYIYIIRTVFYIVIFDII